MSSITDRKSTRVSSANLKETVAEGVGRALAARKAAGIDMSTEQLDGISGGFAPIVTSDGSVFLPLDHIGRMIVLAGGRFYPPATYSIDI